MTTTRTSYPSRTPYEPEPVPRQEPVVYGTAADGPLDDRVLDRYEQRGFLQVDQLLSDVEMVEFESEIQRLVHDPDLARSERVIRELGDEAAVRSIFEVHRLSPLVAQLAADERILGPVEQILGSRVYLHQSRINLKPGLRGGDFYWHSDFETWHLEDGLPEMRCLSVSITLTENRPDNGSLMIIPGAHHLFVGCRGATPEEHYRQSLRDQRIGVPSDAALTRLAVMHGIETITGPAGSAVFFDSNCMHGSNTNITPFARRNIFLVYNSVENPLVAPFGGQPPRPEFVAARTIEPVR